MQKRQRKTRKRNAMANQPVRKMAGANRPRRRRARGGRSGVPNQTRFQNKNVRRPTMKMSTQRADTKRLPQFIEQIGQPLSSQAWALFKSYNVNPGIAATFPIGSAECVNWQKYRFRSLHLVYEPIVNEYNTNNDGAGEIILSFNPDASDTPPTSFAQAINRKPVARGRPCDNIRLTVPPALLHRQTDAHFLRFNVPPGASDIKTYDIGLVDVSVVGCGTTGTTVLGNLFWQYELDVITQQQALVGAPTNFSTSNFQSVAIPAPNGVQTTVPVANVIQNGLGIVNTAGSLVPPAGNYMIDASTNIQGVITALTSMTLDIQKNGASTSTPNSYVTSAANLQTAGTLNSMPVIVSANGTDAFTVTAFFIYTGGAGPTYDTVVRFVAV